MVTRFLNGLLHGTGFIAIVAVAYAIAWAGDVFTVDKDGTLKFAVSDQGKITVGATESYVNLVIQNNAAATNNKVDITADVLTVEGIRLENVNVSADITASGAGGLDTGSEAADTWYYVWVITNNNGTSTNGLISASSTSPTVPSGFTKKRRVGAVRNDGSSNFPQFVQEGNRCDYIVRQVMLSNGQATSTTTISVAAAIPPTSRRGDLQVGQVYTHNVLGGVFHVTVRRPGAAGNQFSVNNICTDTTIQQGTLGFGLIETDATQQIAYSIATVPSGGGGAYIYVLGYYDRI